jgi:NAD(P)-dependent dehydrogenase (short-subunit alcohol dehydrogenase family)
MASSDMQGKTVMVTGATNGIGKVAALELAKMGANVVIVGRSQGRVNQTVKEIQDKTNGKAVLDTLVADLSLMAEVRQVAEAFKSRHKRLDVLLNNAGAIFGSHQETTEGNEMTFALNHLNYFLLTNLLLDTLKASAPARIINVSSDAHQGATINFDDLQSKRYPIGGLPAYSRSKLMNLLFTYELARRLEGTRVTVNAVHPGTVASGFGHNNRGLMDFAMKIVDRFAISPEQGADTLIYLASSPEVADISGKYFYKRKIHRSSLASYDETAARRLWEVSEQVTGLKAAV